MNWLIKYNQKEDFYHGTRNINSIKTKGFIYTFMGEGNQQYGPGFYFTSNVDTAKSHAIQQDENDSYGIVRAKLNIQNPLRATGNFTMNASSIYPELNKTQIRHFVNEACLLYGDAVLEDFGEVSFEGRNNVVNNVIQTYLHQSSIILINDLYKDRDIEKALRLLNKLTNFDGVIIDFETEKYIVAWFPEQINVVSWVV